MGNILNYIQENVEDYDYLIRRIGITLLVIVILWLVQSLISRVVDKYAKKEITVRRLTRASRLILTLVGVGFIIYTWFYSLEAVRILLAIFAFLIFISIQDVMVDMTYYFYILVKRPFKIGDIVEMKDITGIIDDIDVIQIRLMELGNITHNLEPTGRMFTVPNRTFFEDKVFNYTFEQPYIIQDTNILIDFDADIDKAIRLAGELAFERHKSFWKIMMKTKLNYLRGS